MFFIRSRRERLRDCTFKSSISWGMIRNAVLQSCVRPQSSSFFFLQSLNPSGLWVFSQCNTSFPNKTCIWMELVWWQRSATYLELSVPLVGLASKKKCECHEWLSQGSKHAVTEQQGVCEQVPHCGSILGVAVRDNYSVTAAVLKVLSLFHLFLVAKELGQKSLLHNLSVLSHVYIEINETWSLNGTCLYLALDAGAVKAPTLAVHGLPCREIQTTCHRVAVLQCHLKMNSPLDKSVACSSIPTGAGFLFC